MPAKKPSIKEPEKQGWMKRTGKAIRQGYRVRKGKRALSKGTISRKTPTYSTAFHEFALKTKFWDSFPKSHVKLSTEKLLLISNTTTLHESFLSISIGCPSVFKRHAEIKIGLDKERNALIIEAIQGRRGAISDLKRFEKAVGKPWPNHLMELIEKHARKNFFKTIEIRVPESLYYYHKPMAGTVHTKEERKEKIKQIRKRMRIMYNGVADALGYKRKGVFFVKEL